MISPYPPPMPLPLGESRGRYIRPTQRVLQPLQIIPNITPGPIAQCPSPAELFDAVRGWGSVRDIQIWSEPLMGQLSWAARVEFWYEDEANRFEIGFRQQGSHFKGWQM